MRSAQAAEHKGASARVRPCLRYASGTVNIDRYGIMTTEKGGTIMTIGSLVTAYLLLVLLALTLGGLTAAAFVALIGGVLASTAALAIIASRRR